MPDNIVNTTGAESVDTGSVDTSSTEGGGASVEWDGDFDKLSDDIPWWKGVPETARGHITGLRSKLAEAEERSTYLDKLFESDDQVAVLRAEMGTKDTELASLKQALAAAETGRAEFETKAQEAAAKLAEVEDERAFDALRSRYPDIFSDLRYLDAEKKEIDVENGAWVKFGKLLQANIPEEEAAELARHYLPKTEGAAPAKPAERPVQVDPAVRAATAGGSNAATTVRGDTNESLEEAHARIARQAALEEAMAR